MSHTNFTVHCQSADPRELNFFVQEFDSFCNLNLDIRPNDGSNIAHEFDFFFPPSMLQRLSRAVAAFNAEMGVERSDIIEPAPSDRCDDNGQFGVGA